MGTLHPILEQFDLENCCQFGSSKPKKLSSVPDVSTVVVELMVPQAFSFYGGRRLTHFKKPKDLLTSGDKDDCI